MALTVQISSREEKLLLIANQSLQMGYGVWGDCASRKISLEM